MIKSKTESLNHLLCHSLVVLCFLVCSNGQSLPGDQPTCSTDELNRSELVECRIESCKQLDQAWPRSTEQLFHYYSTRDNGDRFKKVTLENLNYPESETEKLFDINSTLYIDSKSKLQVFEGFGTTLDLDKLVPSIDEESFDANIKPILLDLLSIKFSIIRLNISGIALLNGNKVFRFIQELDATATESYDNTGSKIKLILNFKNVVNNHESKEALNTLSASLWRAQHLEVWALTLDTPNDDDSDDTKLVGTIVQNLFKKDIWGVVRQQEAGQYANDNPKGPMPPVSLLLKSKFSLPYNIIDHLRANKNLANLITIGSDKWSARKFGDWQLGQNHAMEIMNHLKHGSNGFIEEESFVNLISSKASPACAIYQIWPKRGAYYRSPMFYAMAHFSQFLKPGSKLLTSSIYTQPNMFGAHYMAAETSDGYYVVVVLNDNEHPTPFRVGIDGKIILNTLVQLKSFNTFLIKQH